jgi:hypothetical protein
MIFGFIFAGGVLVLNIDSRWHYGINGLVPEIFVSEVPDLFIS